MLLYYILDETGTAISQSARDLLETFRVSETVRATNFSLFIVHLFRDKQVFYQIERADKLRVA